MAETLEAIAAKLEPNKIVESFLLTLRKRKPFPKSCAQEPEPLWARVKKATGYGSTYSSAICMKYQLDPNEKWRPDEGGPAAPPPATS